MLTAVYPTEEVGGAERRRMAVFLTILLTINSTTNKGGTGILSIPYGKLNKWEAPAFGIMNWPVVAKAVTDAVHGPLIAHVRTSTPSTRSIEGPHPFVVGHIGLAHNGSFTNYRSIISRLREEHNVNLFDDDPVDSHVFLHWLTRKVAGGRLTEDHIKTALTEVTGEYALLVTDLFAENLWVVTGTRALYMAKVGPMYVINTSRDNLIAAQTLMHPRWWLSSPVRIEEHTINNLTEMGLNRVCDAPRIKE